MIITSADLTFQINYVFKTDTGRPTENLQLYQALTNGSGTNDDEIDLVYASKHTVANSGTPDTFDLSGGGLVGPDRSVASFVHVCTVFVVNLSLTQFLIIGGGSAALFTTYSLNVGIPPSVSIPDKPSYFVLHGQAKNATGALTVTNATHDVFQAATSGAAANDYLVYIAGRSA